MIVLIISPPILPHSGSRPSYPQDELIPGPRGHDQDGLATRIEQQRAKIRALELAAKGRGRASILVYIEILVYIYKY